jgi:glycosyltransferase involved in cell wall biosynthesis
MGSSSRVRFFQYIPYLKSLGWRVDISPFLGDPYLHRLYVDNIRDRKLIFVSYAKRISELLRWNNYDLLWIEKELMQWIPAWLEAFMLKTYGVRYVVDYDDAIFHNYDCHPSRVIKVLYGKKIKTLMAGSSCVFAGNDYIAQYAQQAGAKRIEIIPSVVDMDRYEVGVKGSYEEDNSSFCIGWIGSPSTAKYLKTIELPLAMLAKKRNVELCIIGAPNAPVSGLPVRHVAWSELTEVNEISLFDVGVMPLSDTPWERGKCGFKLIQYMASGKPVIASPVGVNKIIVKNGVNGFLADSHSDWHSSFERLYLDRALGMKMGAVGREGVKENFSLQVMAERVSKILKDLI